MKDLSSYFSAENVALDFDTRKKKDAIRKIAALLAAAGAGDASVLENALIRREDLCSTALGEGVVAPHALLPGLKITTLAFLRTKKPINWKSPDGAPVRLAFAMAGPAEDPGTHLRLLSRLTRLLRDPDFRSEALAAASIEDLAAAFRSREED